MPSQAELRKEITEQIIQSLEEDKLPPWRRPWNVSRNSGRAANVVSKRAYSGINPLLLELHARQHEFHSRWWGTYRQWSDLGGTVQKRPSNVKPGHWGSQIVFYRCVEKKVVDKKTGEEKEETFPLMRTYSVFNADQVDDVERFQTNAQVEPVTNFVDFTPADDLIAATAADIRFGGDEAVYRRPSPNGSWPNHLDGDFICLPHKHQFNPVGSYYETAFHELAHWCEIRTNWKHVERGYAQGELAAEIASCFLASELGIPNCEQKENHVAYVKIWLKAMRNDPSFIFTASTQASKVTDYLLELQKNLQQPVAQAT